MHELDFYYGYIIRSFEALIVNFLVILFLQKIETKAEKAPKKNKQSKPEAHPVEKNIAAEQPEVIVEKEKIKEEVTLVVVQEPAAPAAVAGKEKKKKKSEFNPKQPIR